jgi:hypothetical protein
MKTNPIALCAIAMLFLASCTEAFKHKQEIADKYVDYMNAARVTCGVFSETNNGESMSMTTFTFSDCSSHIEDIEREWAANKVAIDMLGELSEKDLEGETHMKIIAESKAGETFTYLFELPDLRKTDEFLKIADDAVAACIADDHDAIHKIKDNKMMPDDLMDEIYDVTHYNDSIYEGQKLTTEMLGYRFANGADDEELELLSVEYDVKGESAHTYYTINVDRNTKKVVYIWLKTDPY